ncbi:BolA family protein [Phaeovulum sp.]|uniref:BolA family protein n=1 Tax=Phaeovulum sp. TaxID=2934796 RepID=UPI0039E609FC
MKIRVVDEIRQKLAVFCPAQLQVEDESALHEGHAGARPEGETHFRVMIRAAEFAPLSRLERQRRVHAALGAPLLGRIHALALDVDG